jgi:hypothetical protein
MGTELRIGRRQMFGGLAGFAATAAVPARAQLFMPMPPSFDPLTIAREQLARHAHSVGGGGGEGGGGGGGGWGGGGVALADRVGVIDFGQPSRAPRFAVVDMVRGKVDYFPVTHGRGSDPQHDGWLKNFSNRPGSLATSRGAYRTSDYYWGQHGSSMRLRGLEPDNSNAEDRAIVIHGAWYAEPTLIAQQGKLGRSEGCFVFGGDLLPEILYKLGPGRLIVADRYSALPILPPKLPDALLDGTKVVMTASGATLP